MTSLSACAMATCATNMGWPKIPPRCLRHSSAAVPPPFHHRAPFRESERMGDFLATKSLGKMVTSPRNIGCISWSLYSWCMIAKLITRLAIMYGRCIWKLLDTTIQKPYFAMMSINCASHISDTPNWILMDVVSQELSLTNCGHLLLHRNSLHAKPQSKGGL